MVGFTNKGGVLTPTTLYRRYGNDIVDENNLRAFRNIDGQIIEFPKKDYIISAYDNFSIKDRNQFNHMIAGGGAFCIGYCDEGANNFYRPTYEQTKQTIDYIKQNRANVVYKENGIFTCVSSNKSGIIAPLDNHDNTYIFRWMPGDGVTGFQYIVRQFGSSGVFIAKDGDSIKIGAGTTSRDQWNVSDPATFFQDFHTLGLRVDTTNKVFDAFIDGVKVCSFNRGLISILNSSIIGIGGSGGLMIYKNFYSWDALLTDDEMMDAHKWIKDL